MRNLASRYAPFIAIVALQLVLATTNAKTTTVATNGPRASPNDAAASSTDGTTAGSPAAARHDDSNITQAGAAAASAGVSQGAGPPNARSATTPSTLAGGAAHAAASATSQTVDALGRPTAGDKAKCAPGALLQENITVHSPPCIARFTGNNGGATYPGVTADTVNIVEIHPIYPQGVAQALVASGIEASDDQYREFLQIEQDFFNKHYEFYGRKMKVYFWPEQCSDPACWRADAKAMVAKYHPFMATWYTAGIAPEAYTDELTQLGVISAGTSPLSDSFFKQHAPFAWDLFPQGNRQADMLGDYYCKKMWGQNASRAGDPTMQLKKRKLGIITSEEPAALEVAQQFKKDVTGGECGSEADGTTIYTMSADATTASDQYPTLVTRMKNDGITTRAWVGDAPGKAEDDKQQYFPENLMSFASDNDVVGRLYEGLNSPNQMAHLFGIGWQQKAQPVQNQDFYKAIKDINPSYDPPRISQATFYGLSLFAMFMQWAGPNLTPKTVEQGARTSPQIGGWVNPHPWPGWKCCNPYVNEYKFGVDANSYTGKVDAKEEYWDSHAVSADDNQPGAFVCVDPNCRRYEIGQWPKGEAGKP